MFVVSYFSGCQLRGYTLKGALLIYYTYPWQCANSLGVRANFIIVRVVLNSTFIPKKRVKQPLIVWLNVGLVAKPEARHNFQTRTLTGPTVEVFTTGPKRHAMNWEPY